MRHERQLQLLDRLAKAGPRRTGLYAEASTIVPASAYTDPQRFENELDFLFRGGVVVFALSCELPQPGDHQAQTFGGIPLLVVRQPDRSLRAMVNACRHRAAPLVENGRSGHGTVFQCPYHAWTYELDGTLRNRPGSAGAFDDVTVNCDLHQVAVAERYGMILVRPRGREPIDVDAVLAGAEDDLGHFGLADHVHIETRVIERDLNWKLLLDTFCESYHIRTLHKDTLAPYFDSTCVIHESFGPNQLSCGFRNTIDREFDKPRDERSLLPYGTIQYFIVPNLLIVHQIDHIEMWRLEPLAVDRTRATVSVYAPGPPTRDKPTEYYVKNLDLLLEVTDAEDFALMARIQRSLGSGSIPELVYGRIEPPLIRLHAAINDLLAGARPAGE
ncbi:MAG: aromatic ring-hydroxylating dioxygenase subunit alpha [Acidimicrobiia bacterium]|nr:aromatic ring-hydroxylating dioxygenase subunit alpha [Acidimicrobiia bacterium]